MHDPGFLFYAFVFLAAAVAVVPLAKLGGLGSVLGYLLAGILIGPFGLQLISQPEDILHFAEFGVVLMLFLIGLELRPSTLWRLRKSIIGLGSVQVIVTSLVIAAIARLAGMDMATSVTIGLGLGLSSTAIALQILSEKNLFKTYAGQSTFSVLLFQDLAVIPILVLVPLLAMGAYGPEIQSSATAHNGEHVWLMPLKLVGVVTLIVVAGHFGLRHIFRLIAMSRIKEMFTAIALLLVVGVTLLMETIGLSAALGAFVAGVVLADSEYRHEIEIEIEPFKALLLGLFFISVGMSIDFDTLASQPFIILSCVAALIAVKSVILLGLGYIFKMQLSQNILFTFLLAQGGEFGFVIFQFAGKAGLLTPEISNPLILIIALSMILTPLLIIVYDRLIQPRFATFTPLAEPKALPEEAAPVIIAGYGRFGQIVGRLLHAQGVSVTILDHDPNQIDMARKYGAKVFFGDVTDLALLRAAGTDKAKILVLAIDDRENAVRAAKLIREHFPGIKILARARDRHHAYKLTKAGVDIYHREMFESALSLGEQVLVGLGYRAFMAREKARKFARHDKRTLKESFEHFEDEEALISFSLRSAQDLARIFEQDRRAAARKQHPGWEESPPS